MDEKQLTVCLRYYGISPWEIEVVYNLFNGKFEVIQEETEQTELNFVSALTIIISLPFNEEFFKWFEFREWAKVKHIIKEMKRRRGKGNAIIIEIIFTGDPNIRFVTDLSENHNFNSAIEKIDFMVELLPYHLNHSKMKNWCKKPQQVNYGYDVHSGKWYVDIVARLTGYAERGTRSFNIDDLRDL